MTSVADTLAALQDQYRVEENAAHTDDVTIFRAVPYDGYRVVTAGGGPAIGDISSMVDDDPYTDSIRVGETVFLGIIHHHFPPTDPFKRPSHWQEARRLIRQAARRIDPALAGFPEWNRIYADDPYFLSSGVAAGLHWGSFQITSYKRRLHRLQSKARAPHRFRQGQRQRLLGHAGHRCQRCGSRDALELDHIIPVTHGGTNDDENALVLCKACHLEKTRAERKILGLSGYWIEHNESPERHIAVTRLTASPAVFLAELERRADFALSTVQDE